MTGKTAFTDLAYVLAPYKWMKEKGKLGGQNKVPRLANNNINNKEYLKKWKREWYKKNCMNNPEYKAHRKKYQKENLARRRESDRKRYNEDSNIRMKKILRAQVTYSIKRGYKLNEKCTTTLKI